MPELIPIVTTALGLGAADATVVAPLLVTAAAGGGGAGLGTLGTLGLLGGAGLGAAGAGGLLGGAGGASAAGVGSTNAAGDVLTSTPNPNGWGNIQQWTDPNTGAPVGGDGTGSLAGGAGGDTLPSVVDPLTVTAPALGSSGSGAGLLNLGVGGGLSGSVLGQALGSFPPPTTVGGVDVSVPANQPPDLTPPVIATTGGTDLTINNYDPGGSTTVSGVESVYKPDGPTNLDPLSVVASLIHPGPLLGPVPLGFSPFFVPPVLLGPPGGGPSINTPPGGGNPSVPIPGGGGGGATEVAGGGGAGDGGGGGVGTPKPAGTPFGGSGAGIAATGGIPSGVSGSTKPKIFPWVTDQGA